MRTDASWSEREATYIAATLATSAIRRDKRSPAASPPELMTRSARQVSRYHVTNDATKERNGSVRKKEIRASFYDLRAGRVSIAAGRSDSEDGSLRFFSYHSVYLK